MPILEKTIRLVAIGRAVLVIGLIETGVGVVDAGVGRVHDLTATSRTGVREALETIAAAGRQAQAK